MSFTVLASPTISSFSPASGNVGAAVALSGSLLDLVSSVRFNGVPANFSIDSATQITAIVPAGCSSGLIEIVAPGSSARSSTGFVVIGGGGGIGLNSANTFTKRQAVAPVNLTFAATVNVDLNASNNFILTLIGNVSLAFTNITAGTSGWIDLIQDSVGSRTLTLPAICKKPGGAALALTTTPGAKDKLFYSSSDGTTLDIVLNKDFK